MTGTTRRPPSPAPVGGLTLTVCGPVRPEALLGAETVEVRADRWPGGPYRALDFLPGLTPTFPTIFTCRLPGEGGSYADSEQNRLALFERALEHGASVLDIEARSDLLPTALERDWPVLASYHDFTRTELLPHGAAEHLADLARAGALAAKIVETAGSVGDLRVVRDLLAARRPLPLAAFLMGEAGLPSRFLALGWGSLLTYAAADAAVAPGQLTAVDLIGTFGGLQALSTKRRHVALAVRPARPTPELLALTGAVNDALDAATLAVPYPGVERSDYATILQELNAVMLLEFDDHAGLTVYRTRDGSLSPAHRRPLDRKEARVRVRLAAIVRAVLGAVQ